VLSDFEPPINIYLCTRWSYLNWGVY